MWYCLLYSHAAAQVYKNVVVGSFLDTCISVQTLIYIFSNLIVILQLFVFDVSQTDN